MEKQLQDTLVCVTDEPQTVVAIAGTVASLLGVELSSDCILRVCFRLFWLEDKGLVTGDLCDTSTLRPTHRLTCEGAAIRSQLLAQNPSIEVALQKAYHRAEDAILADASP